MGTTFKYVKAKPGIKVPKEDKPREYITEDAVSAISESAYYFRRLLDGDLVEVDEKEFQEQQAAATKAAEAEKPAKNGAK